MYVRLNSNWEKWKLIFKHENIKIIVHMFALILKNTSLLLISLI